MRMATGTVCLPNFGKPMFSRSRFSANMMRKRERGKKEGEEANVYIYKIIIYVL